MMKQTSSTLSVKDFQQTETCPDCIERNDVDLTGRPRKGRHHRIAQCAGCWVDGKKRGDGRVPRAKVDLIAWWVSKRGEP